jgi:hypothetical protein
MPLLHLDLDFPVEYTMQEDGSLAVELITLVISPESRDHTAACRLANSLRREGIMAIPEKRSAFEFGNSVACLGTNVSMPIHFFTFFSLPLMTWHPYRLWRFHYVI